MGKAVPQNLHIESAKKNIKRVSQSKVLPELSTEIPRSATIKRTARDRHNQKYNKGISHLKEMPGSVTIKCTFREWHNRKNCQGMPKSKVYPESATIKSTARKCHKLKYNQGVQQL